MFIYDNIAIGGAFVIRIFSYAFAEPELHIFRKLKYVGRNEQNGHKNSNNIRNHHDGIALYQGISKRNALWHSTPKQRTHQKQFYRLWWVQLTNVQCHMVPISTSWCRESWTIQLKNTIETKQERLAISRYPTHRHCHSDPWYVYVSQKSLFQLLRMYL